MQKLRKFGYASLIPMTLALPIWLTFGRAALGSTGWLLLVYLLIIAPVLLVSMIILSVLIRRRTDVKTSQLVSPTDAWLLTLFYASVLLHGFFVVDGGDTEDSINSVATHIFGRGFQSASDLLAGLFFIAGVGLLVALLIVSVSELLKNRKPR